MRLVEQWPLDPTKSAKRDLGALLRKKIGEAFPQGEASSVPDLAKCDRTLDALNKINSDFYKKKYAFGDTKFGATGMDYEQVHISVSDEGLKQIDKEFGGKGFFKMRFKLKE